MFYARKQLSALLQSSQSGSEIIGRSVGQRAFARVERAHWL